MHMSEVKDTIDYKSLNVYQKVLQVMGAVEYLEYDGEVKFGQTNYRYLSETKITTTIRDAMLQVGLVMVPVNSEPAQLSIDGRAITQCVMTYRIVNSDKIDEYFDIQMTGFGRDNMDKGILKAQTAAFKYAQRQAFMVPTGVDPDKVSNEELETQAVEQAKKDAVKKIEDDKKAAVKKATDEKKEKMKGYTSELRKFDRKQWRGDDVGPLVMHPSVPMPDGIIDMVLAMETGEHEVDIGNFIVADYKGETVLALTEFPNPIWRDVANAIAETTSGLTWCMAGKSSHWFHPDGGLDKANFPKGNYSKDRVVAITNQNGVVYGEIVYKPAGINSLNGVFIPTVKVDRNVDPWSPFFIDRVLDNMIIADANATSEGRRQEDMQFTYGSEYREIDNCLIELRLNNVTERRAREIESSLRWTIDKMLNSLS